MKKSLALTLTALLLCTLGTGCGKTNNNDTAQGSKVELMIGLPGGDGVTPMSIVDNFIEARKDKYNITADTTAWDDYTKKTKLQFVSKNDVTPVFFTDSLQAPSYGAQGALEDLKPYVEKDLDASKYTSALTTLQDTEGHLWGVPHGINSIAMLYNKDLFDERDVAYPTEDWTWQDMLDMAKKLTFDRNGDGETDVYGIYYTTNVTQGWLPFMAAVGVNPYKDDYRNANLDDPKILEAYQKYQQPIKDGIVPDPAFLASYGSPAGAVAEGVMAMYVCQMSEMTSINNLNPDLNYDTQIMPIGWNGERTCIYVPNVWVMYSGASDEVKAAAWDWMKFFLNEESQMIIANEGVTLPCLNTALEAYNKLDKKPKGKSAFYRGIDDYGMTILENPCVFDCDQIIQTMTHKVRLGEDAASLIPQANADMQEALDVYYNSL